MSEEKLTGFIGFRARPSWKAQMREEAVERGETLSQYIYELIEAGWEQMGKENVKRAYISSYRKLQ